MRPCRWGTILQVEDNRSNKVLPSAQATWRRNDRMAPEEARCDQKSLKHSWFHPNASAARPCAKPASMVLTAPSERISSASSLTMVSEAGRGPGTGAPPLLQAGKCGSVAAGNAERMQSLPRRSWRSTASSPQCRFCFRFCHHACGMWARVCMARVFVARHSKELLPCTGGNQVAASLDGFDTAMWQQSLRSVRPGRDWAKAGWEHTTRVISAVSRTTSGWSKSSMIFTIAMAGAAEGP